MVVNDAAQMLRQMLPARPQLARSLRAVCLMGLQCLQLPLQIGLILGSGVLEHLALMGIHRFGAG